MSHEENAVVQEASNTEFNDLLRGEINNGGGFVPFIGSGCSSPSGILMGVQFDEYLSYTVFLCVADTKSVAEAETALERRWDLRSDGWPKQPTTEQVGIARKWIRREFDKICEKCGFRALPEGEAEIQSLELASRSQLPEDLAKALTCPLLPRILRSSHSTVDQETLKRLLPFFGAEGLERGGYSVPGISPTSQDAIIERAIRVLYDWRATLNFLSKLKLVHDNTLLVEECEQAVIDGFNVHITRGRKPNLIHNMLCHLAAPARFRVILTTNFDSLIEDAFREVKERVEVISVSVKGALPDPEVVHARNSLVKMHGTLSETRADFSLDESPSRENKRRFFHYVRGSYPDEKGERFLPAQLLVCGYSGADNRCVEMIKYVLDAGGPEARVYWICYSKADLKRVDDIFREEAYKVKGPESRVIATVTERCDLLLHELFQRFCLSLPGGGPSYQYSYHVPPDVSGQGDHGPHVVKEAQRIVNEVGWFEEPTLNRNPARKLLVVDGKVGVVATLRQVLQILTGDKRVNAIWLELQDFQDTYCLAYSLLQIISNRLGLFQLGYADLLPARLISDNARCLHAQEADEKQLDQKLTERWKEHLKFLVDHYFSIVPGKWVIVLYGRKGPGTCAGWEKMSFWGDKKTNEKYEYGTDEKAGHFPPFVKALCELGFHVIYAPYSQDLHDQNEGKIKKLQKLLGKESADPKLTDLYKGYPEAMIHNKERLDSWFTPLRGNTSKDNLQGKFPGKINHRCEWPDALKFADFDRTVDQLFENWVSSHANRHLATDSGAGLEANSYLENLQFLYAITLFRSARPYSSFADEGVLPAAYMFNVAGRDNDWERNEKLVQHLADLKKIGLFYQKPGGFAWAYRDLRLGLRWMIESLPIEVLEKHKIEPFEQWRSHYHYWIADWYLRAFYTTGHAVPLMEGLYHLYQTIQHLGSFRDAISDKTELAWRRYLLWRKAACELAKALRVGRDAICLWLGPPLLRSWFPPGECEHQVTESIREKLSSLLGPILEKIKPHADSIIEVLQGELQQFMLRGENEGRIKHYEGQVASTQLGPTEKSDGKQSAVFQPELKETLESLCTRSKTPQKEADLKKDLCEAFSDLDKIFEESLTNEYLLAGSLDSRQLTHKICDWQRRQLQQPISDRHFFYLIQELNERAFLYLREAKLRQLVNLNRRRDRKKDREEQTEYLGLTFEVKRLWIRVTILAGSALEFCRLLHPTLAAFEGKERVKALCLSAVALARLCRFYEAHRRLNEADALLSKIHVSGSDRDVLLGILELRRAEAHLLEGMLVGELCEEADPSYSMNKTPNAQKKAGMTEALYKRYSIELRLCPDAWRKHQTRLQRLRLAKLDDGWCALERAERLLAGRLRSSHWWSRLCVLKLRCLAEQCFEKDACFRSLARRIQSHPLNQIYDLLYRGLAGCQEETRASSRLRLIDLALRNADCLTRGNLTAGQAAFAELKKVAERIVKPILDQIPNKRTENEYPHILAYAKNIHSFLNDWKGPLDSRQLEFLLTATGNSPSSVAVDPSGRFAYVANFGGNGLCGYTINPANGALTAIAGSPFAAGNFPQAVKMDPSGKLVYVTSFVDNTLLGYSINPTTGTLTAFAGPPIRPSARVD